MAENTLHSFQSTNHQHILVVIAGLISGDIPACQALEDLEMLAAPAYLIASVRQIEAMFAPRDPDYCGPMDETVRKVQGDA